MALPVGRNCLLLILVARAACISMRSASNASASRALDAWSTLSAGGACSDGHCEVPPGQTWILDESMEVETLIINGTLKWDTEKDGLVLRSSYILIPEGGYLQVGTKSNPIRRKATIYIKKGSSSHPEFGDRFLASHGDARVDIHGRKLERTWTLLSRTALAGSDQLFLKHDPWKMGWQVGDHIGIATTTRGKSVERYIQAIGAATEWQLRPSSVKAGIEKLAWQEGAANVIDGDLGSRWGSWCAPYCAGDDQWLEVTLEKPSLVKRIRLLWDRMRFAPEYKVMVRMGDESWKQAALATNATGGWQELSVLRNATKLRIEADYRKMMGRGTEDAYTGLGLYELQVFGQELNEAPQTVVFLDRPLEYEHWGGFREVQGYHFEMAAEVVNLQRSVVITGDHDDFDTHHKGLHTISSHGGIMDVRYTRVEYCGQRDFMGKYCMHFHHGGHCIDCVFQGNAVYQSAQLGIVVHGTHRSLVDNNVLWDVAAAGIFTEDGNEMHNTFNQNVLICSWHEKCTTLWRSQLNHSAGIYLIGMTNNLIENRIVGYENGIWTPGSIALWGQGSALGRVCPQSTPFGTIRGNVNHDNARFGLYLDGQHPRNLERDKEGFVTNFGTCAEFSLDGRDNGVVPANLVEDEFDWHNTFVGQYSIGDISFVRLKSVNNVHDMYWKESKNFADGKAHHILDSIFAHDPLDKTVNKIASVAGPAGPFTFKVTNTTFVGGPLGCGALCAGQHCGLGGAGGPCNVQYLLTSVDFSKVFEHNARIRFGLNTVDMGYVQPMFLSSDDSLGGHRSIVSKHLNGFADVDGCVATEGATWDGGIACSGSVRRLNLWSMNLGSLKIRGAGYDVPSNDMNVVKGMNAGNLLYEPMHGGYGAVVILGKNYTLEGSLRGDIAVELSDVQVEEAFGGPETLKLAVANDVCQLSAQDDRSFLGVHGPPPETYLKRSCLTTAFEGGDIYGVQTTTSRATTSPPDVAPPGRVDGQCEFPNQPAVPFFWDPFCAFGKLGCFADGKNVECRFCGAGDWATIACPASTTTSSTTTSTASVWGGSSPSTSGWLQQRSGLCLTASSVQSKGEQLTIKPCSFGRREQLFTYNASLLQIRISDGSCLDAYQGMLNGGRVHTWPCDPENTNQRFVYNRASGLIWNRHGVCLDAPQRAAEGSSVHMWRCFPSQPNQHWNFTAPPAPPPVGLQLQLRDGICLAAKKLDAIESSLLQMAACDSSAASQEWFYIQSIKQIRNAGGLCLMAPHAGGIVKAKIAFTPVRGGQGMACRGSSWSDNDRSNWLVFLGVKTLEKCKQKCVVRAACTAIEFNPFKQRCEVWTKPVNFAVRARNFTCLTAALADNTLAIFEAVDGGIDRVCRGDHAGDNQPNYFTVSKAASLEDCKHKCAMATGYCTGFEYHMTGRCELWSKPVGASAGIKRYRCEALATILLAPCNVSEPRQHWAFNQSAGSIASLQDGACLDAVGSGRQNGGRVRLLTCNAESATQRWETPSMLEHELRAVEVAEISARPSILAAEPAKKQERPSFFAAEPAKKTLGFLEKTTGAQRRRRRSFAAGQGPALVAAELAGLL